jgi:hypothetical protein
VRRVEWPFSCTASLWVCSRRPTKLPIVYPDRRLDYKVATLPFDVYCVTLKALAEFLLRFLEVEFVYLGGRTLRL